MSQKENLQEMLDDLINNKPEQAETTFHSYLEEKMQDVVIPSKLEDTDESVEEKSV